MLTKNQKEAVARLSKWKVGALFMEAGTGKTRVAMELINHIEDIGLVVWLGPLATIRGEKSSVQAEFDKWGGLRYPVVFCGVESISASERIFLELQANVEGAKNVFMVVDESLKIKNFEAIRTRRIIELGKLAKYRLVLNGTPMSRNILDLWAQMEFLSHSILNMNLRRFKNTFCYYTKVEKTCGYRHYCREFVTGHANIDYLYSLIRHYVYECDLHLDIKQNYHALGYRIGKEEREAYNDVKREFLSDEMLEFKNNNIFLEMTVKMQHMYCVTEDKFTVLDRLFTQVKPKDTIIFCRFIKSMEECRKRYPDCLVLSYQKESFGLNLQDYRNTVYFDKVWDYALRIQSGRRTYRQGQEFDCQYYDLTGDIGLEHLIDANIEKKIGMVEYFKGKTKEELEAAL